MWLALTQAVTPRLTKYIPHEPTPKQAAFLLLNNRESFYGGAAGGGKSDALLMGALQYVDIPGYAALILRRSYADLILPKALMSRAHEWLDGTDARWREIEKTWYFPSGALLSFGYLKTEKHKYRYQSAEFQYVAFDELTQFSEGQYRYLFSRLRRLKGVDIPIRMRSASNPGNIGHDWVKRRFLIEGAERGRVFIPAKLQDNPYLDQDEYIASLMELDPITRQQLLDGDWSARESGGKLRREWFRLTDFLPADFLKIVRFWDLAATEPKKGRDPDWTAGAKMGITREGLYFIGDIRRIQGAPPAVERLIKETARFDGKGVDVWVEIEPGASSRLLFSHYARHVLPGYTFRGRAPRGSKEARANPLSSQADAGNVFCLNGVWLNDWLDEADAFPYGSHDDQVDGVSGAYEILTGWYERWLERQADQEAGQAPKSGPTRYIKRTPGTPTVRGKL